MGRPKGAKNKLPANAQAAIEKAFEGIGGVHALTLWARGNKDDFYTKVWSKLVPKNVDITTLGEQLPGVILLPPEVPDPK